MKRIGSMKEIHKEERRDQSNSDNSPSLIILFPEVSCIAAFEFQVIFQIFIIRCTLLIKLVQVAGFLLLQPR